MIVQRCCFLAECDACHTVLEDYGDYQGMDSAEAAAGYAVAEHRWRIAVEGRPAQVRLYCASCVAKGFGS